MSTRFKLTARWLGVVLLGMCASACASARTLRFEASEPSEIRLGQSRVCTSTPCEYHYEPQGCGFPRLAATHHVIVTATTPDGRSAHVAEADYCDLEGTIFLQVPAK